MESPDKYFLKQKALFSLLRKCNSIMFIVNLNYIAPLEQIDTHMNTHMRFLKKYYANNTFMMSGRKVPRTGGIILAKANTKAEIEAIMKEDPFISNKLAEFSVIEFQTSQFHPDLKNLLT